MIAIIDYHMGNLGSVQKALAYIGCESVITSDPMIIDQADRLILPGVGAMSYAMEKLTSLKLDIAIKQYLAANRPFLGICLGMQLMFERSEEGHVKGLGFIKGCVTRFPQQGGIKIPHMGWNQLHNSKSELLQAYENYYFVHSYFVKPDDPAIIAASSFHGLSFAAAVETEQILLTQFHPEKSGDAGLRLLEAWVKR